MLVVTVVVFACVNVAVVVAVGVGVVRASPFVRILIVLSSVFVGSSVGVVAVTVGAAPTLGMSFSIVNWNVLGAVLGCDRATNTTMEINPSSASFPIRGVRNGTFMSAAAAVMRWVLIRPVVDVA